MKHAMRKKSTYCDAFRELVGGANKRLAIWNGLSSIRLNEQLALVGFGRLPYVIKAPCA